MGWQNHKKGTCDKSKCFYCIPDVTRSINYIVTFGANYVNRKSLRESNDRRMKKHQQRRWRDFYFGLLKKKDLALKDARGKKNEK